MSEESEGELPWVCAVVEHCQPGVQRYLEGNQLQEDEYEMDHIGLHVFTKQN